MRMDRTGRELVLAAMANRAEAVVDLVDESLDVVVAANEMLAVAATGDPHATMEAVTMLHNRMHAWIGAAVAAEVAPPEVRQVYRQWQRSWERSSVKQRTRDGWLQ